MPIDPSAPTVLVLASYAFYFYGTWDAARDESLPLSAPHWALLCLAVIFVGSTIDFYIGRESALVSVLVQLKRLLILRNGILQQFFLGVQTSCRKVIDCQSRMHTQVHHGEISGTRLRLLSIRLHIAAYSSPRIHLVRKVNRQYEVIKRYAIEIGLGRAISGIQLARSSGRRGHGRIVIGASITERRSRLLILRHRSFQILV